MSKTLDLRNLTPEARNAAINEAVARMEGWTEIRFYHPSEHRDVHGGNRPGTPLGCWSALPPYVTSGDAVMPLLEKCRWSCTREDLALHEPYYLLTIYTAFDSRVCANGKAFPLTACIALLRAHGWEVLT